MRFPKLLALSVALLMLTTALAAAVPVQAEEGNARTQINLGVKRDWDGTPTGDEDTALPQLVRVGETRQIFGRIMQLPSGKDLQPFPDAPVKLIDVFNNAQNPIVLATARSDSEGYFVFEWKVTARPFKQVGEFELIEGMSSLKRLRLTVLGAFDGDSEHSKSTSRGYIVNLKPLQLSVNIKTDKQLYNVNEAAQVTVTIRDNNGELTDPDTLGIFFDSKMVSEIKEDIGTYRFKTPSLSESVHKVSVVADKEEFLREVIFATITVSNKVEQAVDLQADLDQDAYGLGDIVVIMGKAHPIMEGSPVLINVANPGGLIFNFGQVNLNSDGSFTHQFRLVGPLATSGEWKVTFTYLGSQITEPFAVGELPTQILQISVQSASVVNDKGAPVDTGSVDTSIGIETELVNKEDREISFYYIVQVKDSEGLTVKLDWIKGFALKPSASVKPAIFWIPESGGNYTAEIFLWDGLESPVALSGPKSVTLNIV